MNHPVEPTDIAPPLSHYSHGIEAPASTRWLHVSGQLGIRPDGTPGDGITEQAELAWANVASVLAAAGMSLDDLVKVTTFLTRPEDVDAVREVRERVLGGRRPASTLLVVSALVQPHWHIEIEAVAAAQ